MPIPKPGASEAQDEFITRCMGDGGMNSEFPDRDQRAAVCYREWRGAKGKAAKGARYVKSLDAKAAKIKTDGGSGDAGWIEGYASVFGVLDLGGDIVFPGAFNKTIKERVAAGKVKLMAVHYAHGGATSEVVGTITEAKEDDYGLWVHAELSPDASAQEIRQKVNAGHVNGLSIGYELMTWEAVTRDNGKSGTNIKEAKLWETTITPTPMNELALITASKAVDSADAIIASAVSPDHEPCDSDMRDALDALQTIQGKIESLLDSKASAPQTPDFAGRLHHWKTQVRTRKLTLQRLRLEQYRRAERDFQDVAEAACEGPGDTL